MLEAWTGDIVGLMHTHHISSKEMAAELGWHEKYLSSVLNGHRAPKGAEEKCRKAISEIIARKGMEGKV